MADPRPEFAFIEWLRSKAPRGPLVTLGIGDDAALLEARDRGLLVALDLIAEGVHFAPDTPPELIGRKALNVNVSDIAAMAGEPVAAFIGLLLPKSRGRAEAERIYEGLLAAAGEFNITVAGGDTNSWDGPLALSVTLLGEVTGGRAVTRGGTMPGDWIFVTGRLGGSLASGRHLTFTPRIREAQELHGSVRLHAMLDVSDGLASDLFHLLGEEGTGALLQSNAIPIHDDVDPRLPFAERLQHALQDGEDFEMIFSVGPEDGRRLLEQNPLSIPVTKIGVAVAEDTVEIVMEGRPVPLTRGGWSHGF